MSAGIYYLNGHIGSSTNFSKVRCAGFVPLEFIHRLPGESDADYSERLRVAEQRHLGRNGVAVGPDPSEFVKSSWCDPAYRAARLAEMRERRGPITEETRRRMSESKKGRRNPNSRPVIVTDPDGIETEFDSVTAVAEFFGVTQQTMDLWMSGKVKWPAPGKGRKVNRWVAGYKARFKEPCESSPEPQPTR